MPSCARRAWKFEGYGSVNVFLNLIKSAQSMARDSGRIPFPDSRRAASTAAAAATRTFFGSQPRRAQVPPNGRLSTIATVQAADRHSKATACAAAPEPITTRSNDCVIFSRRYGLSWWRIRVSSAEFDWRIFLQAFQERSDHLRHRRDHPGVVPGGSIALLF